MPEIYECFIEEADCSDREKVISYRISLATLELGSRFARFDSLSLALNNNLKKCALSI